MKALKRVLFTIVALAGFLGTEVVAQEPLEVTIIYGPIPRPTHVAMVKGWYEEEMNRVRPVKIVWKYFEFGPPMIAAIASNSVDLTTVVGTIPTIVAIEQGVDLYIVYPLTGLGRTEGIALRGKAAPIRALKGKTLGVPFGTTAHMSAVFGLQQNGLASNEVKFIDFRPTDLVAAWRRGDVDAGAVWSPFFVQLLEADGKEVWTDVDVLRTSGILIADVMVARGEFKRKYPELVEAFVRATLRGYQFQKEVPEQSYEIIAQRLNQPVALVREINQRFIYPEMSELTSSRWMGADFQKSLVATAEFLNQLGRLKTQQKDYTRWVDPSFIEKSLGKQTR
jgi:taurine ABC transporter substrate-binding protein